MTAEKKWYKRNKSIFRLFSFRTVDLRTGNGLLDILSNPFFLAIPFSIALALAIHGNYEMYRTGIVDFMYQETDRENMFLYEDIDMDGVTEYIYSYNLITNATIILHYPDRTVRGVWNLPGYWYIVPDYTLYDWNRDGVSDLFALTVSSEDQIIASMIDLSDEESAPLNKTITRMSRYYDNLDMQLMTLGCEDITGDGKKEFIFLVSAGFTLQPRGVFAWDIANDTVYKSPYSGINYKSTRQFLPMDLNGDGSMEIFVSNSATHNIHEPYVLPDTASYAVVFTSGLEYFFQPVPVAGPTSSAWTLPLIENGQISLLSFVYDIRSSENRSQIVQFDLSGNIIRRRVFEKELTGNSVNMVNGKYIVCQQVGDHTEIGYIDSRIIFTKLNEFEGSYYVLKLLDLDEDRQSEMILMDGAKNRLIFLQDNFRKTTRIDLPEGNNVIKSISIKYRDGNKTGVFFDCNTSQFTVEYELNPNRYMKYPVFILMYATLLFLFLLLHRIFISSYNRRTERERNIVAFQLQSVMNQLSPHFTFNAINAIGDNILKGEREKAFEYFTKLSELIRKSMTNAFQPYKMLGEEIEFVQEYLEIQKFRFEDQLSWNIYLGEEVDTSITVPKMLIHIFVENAVKHGLFHKKGVGTVSIHVDNVGSGIGITIIDDGIGIKRSKEINRESGKGLLLLNNYLDLFSKSQGINIAYTMREVSPKSKYPGTRVEIMIQKEMVAQKRRNPFRRSRK